MKRSSIRSPKSPAEHPVECRLEARHHIGAGLALVGMQPLFALGLFHGQPIVAEGFERPRHVAQLVLNIGAGNLDLIIAVRQFPHRLRHAGDGLA